MSQIEDFLAGKLPASGWSEIDNFLAGKPSRATSEKPVNWDDFTPVNKQQGNVNWADYKPVKKSTSQIDAFLAGAPAKRSTERAASVNEMDYGTSDVSQSARSGQQRTWGEAASDTGVQLAEGVNTLIGAVPDLIAPESAASGFFKSNAEFWRDKQSDALKGRIASADRAIDAAGEEGVISQIAEAASQYFSDPALAARFVTTNLPSMIPGIGAAKLAQGAALARGATAARAAAAATTAAGVTNAALNAGGARGEAFDDIKRTLEARGYSADEAERIALEDSRIVAAVGGLAGFVSGKTGLERSLVGKAATGSAVKAAGRAAGAELAGEQIEELAPKIATNVQAGQYDGRDATKDIGRTIVETAIGTGPGAIVAGGASGIEARRVNIDARRATTPTTADETSQRAPIDPAAAPQPSATQPPLTEGRRMRPEARLAELELARLSRPLNEVEIAEGIALLRQIQGEDTQDGVSPAELPQTELPMIEPQDAVAAMRPATALSDPPQDQGGQSSPPRTVSTSLDALSPPFAGSAPDAAPVSQAAVSPAALGNFWTFAATRGYKPGQLRVGTPEHTTLKAEFAALKKAGGQRAQQSDRLQPAAPVSNAQSILPVASDAEQLAQPVPTVTDAAGTAATPDAAMAGSAVRPPNGMDPALQNRDRSRAASVAQMADIARNPDYLRLATSRTPDSGAPMVFAVGDDDLRFASDNWGHRDTAVMADGQRVAFRYAVIDARQVEPSNFADGRTNPAFASNEPGIVKALNNGRTAGLRAAYEMGTADTYRVELIADAAAHGVSVQAIERTPNPVLVRVYSEQSNRPDMAARSQAQGLGMSPAELARQDAPLIDASVLAVYQAGDVTTAANRDFVRAFVGKLRQSGQDVAGMMTAEGTLSPAGRQRIQAAMTQAAYGDAELVADLFDSLDSDIKAIGEALKAVAGEWANLRDSARQGLINPAADITDNLTQAVALIRKARAERASLYELTRQPDLMTGQTPDDITVGALRFFYTGTYLTRAAGRDAIIASLRDYARAAMGTSASADMFGQVITPTDILNRQAEPGVSDAQDPTQEGGRGTDRGSPDVRGADPTGAPDQRLGDTGARREAGADRAPGRGADEGREQPDAAVADAAGRAGADVAERPAARRGAESAGERRLDDVGEQLYANRRNFTGRGIRWEDVESLNDTLKVKEVTKAKVWPRPDYEQLVADGMPPILARLVKQVYDGLSAGPTIRSSAQPTDADLKSYIDTMARVREALFGFVNTRQQVAEFARGVLTMVNGDPATLGPVSLVEMSQVAMGAQDMQQVLLRRLWPLEMDKPRAGRFARGSDAQRELAIVGGNKALVAMQFGRDDLRKWMADLGKGWPAPREAWQVQGYRVLAPSEYRIFGQEREDGTVRSVVSPTSGRGQWTITHPASDLAAERFMLVQDGGFKAESFDTREAAIDAARAKVKRDAGAGQDTRGTNIEDAERIGPARRQDGEDITPQKLMETFGFRGVNFGREGWINQAERQAYINQAYDGLIDLADVLGVPSAAMSLGGKLGIAFGAQGKGKAAAHFVPGVNEINLTRTRGAGTLAHEWGHALDHHFALQAGLAKDAAPFLSEHGSKADTTRRAVLEGNRFSGYADEPTFGTGIRPEIVQAFRQIYQAMDKRDESPGESATRRDVARATTLKRLDGWLAAARRQIEDSPAPNKAELLTDFDQQAERMRAGDAGDGYVKSGKQMFAARVAAVRNLIKDATGRLWSADETLGLHQAASHLSSLIGKQEADTAHQPQRVSTRYKTDSAAMDREKGGKAYWSTPTEMFARAFELYVHDRLAQRQGRNTFLTNSDERASKPVQIADTSSAFNRAAGATRDLYLYPAGKEREAIGSAFDSLVGQVKTKPDDGGLTIYSTTGRSVPLPTGQRVVEAAVAQEIENRIGQFAHQPTVVIRDSAEGVLPGASKADGIAGAVHDGRIFLFLDQLSTLGDVQETLFHELFHYGVRKVFSREQFIREMLSLYERDAWIKERADAWVKTAEGKRAAQYGGEDYALARGVDETLARLAEPNAGAYTRTDAFNRAIVNVTGWLANLAQRLGFTKVAAKLRGIRNQEARQLIERIFRTLETQAQPEHAGWMSSAEPAFSRNSIGGEEPPTVEPEQQSAWTRAKAKAMQLTSPAAIDSLIYEFQDKYVDLKRLRDHIKAIGGTLTDLNDAYLGEELFHKRLAKRTADFLDKEVKPLLADMRSRSVSLAELERYLHARHAPEANRALAKRNPNRAELDALRAKADADVRDLQLQLQRATSRGTAVKAIQEALNEARAESLKWKDAQAFSGPESDRLALSGMSDQEARQYMDSLTPRVREHMEALARRVDDIQAKTLQALDQYGLIDSATLAGWRSQYQHYVPLHRDEAHAESDRHPIGQGFSVKGTGVRSRVGSTERVTNILAHIAMQRETALTRGEKNHVVKKLYLLAAQNPDEDFWRIDQAPQIKTIDGRTGFVRIGVDPAFKRLPNVVMVRIGGRDQAIVFNEHNPQALRLAEAMKNMDVGDLHVVLGLAAKGTRWFASINTQYNPIFGLINFARDVQAGLLNLSTTPLAGKQAEVASHVLSAMRAVYRQRRGKADIAPEWTRLWDEFEQVGGTTGYRDLFSDAQDRASALTKQLAALDRGNVSKAAHAVVDWLSDYNETMENAVRLSAYKVAIDAGMTKERAASLAKNITVNFNRKGRQTREIGALYAFFNAALQGTARMVETLRGPLGRRIMYGGVLLGVANTLLGMAVMGAADDDEPDNWDQIPDFIKERSIIIPLGRKDYVSIPMPLGFNVFPNIGRIATEFALGGSEKSLGRQIGKLLMALTEAFNPLGGSQNLGQMVAPTVVDPVVALMQNRDWTGKQIYRQNANGLDPQPGHRMTKDSASTPSRALAEAINRITGGTEYRPGAWSPTPDQLDYVFGQLTGGLGRELLKVNQTAAATVTGDELPPYKIPLVGRLYGNTRGPSGQSEKFYENVKQLNEIENEYKGRARNGQSLDALVDSEPLVRLIGLGNGSENLVRKLREQRRRVVERKDPGYQDQVRDIDTRIGETMARLNAEVAKARREAAR
jgi:hypothetical protein